MCNLTYCVWIMLWHYRTKADKTTQWQKEWLNIWSYGSALLSVLGLLWTRSIWTPGYKLILLNMPLCMTRTIIFWTEGPGLPCAVRGSFGCFGLPQELVQPEWILLCCLLELDRSISDPTAVGTSELLVWNKPVKGRMMDITQLPSTAHCQGEERYFTPHLLVLMSFSTSSP